MDDTTCRLRKHHIFGENGTELPNNVYIFGHSLDITDKDVIKDFIDRDGVQTTIFYYDKQQQTQQIANLVKMLGKDTFINMINSVPPPQKNMFCTAADTPKLKFCSQIVPNAI